MKGDLSSLELYFFPLMRGRLAQVGAVVIFMSLSACGGDGDTTDGQAQTDADADAEGAGGEQDSTVGGSGGHQAAGGTNATGGAEPSGGASNLGGSTQGAGGNAIVSCGDATCGPGEYCRAGCDGTGGPIGPPSCAVLPSGCEEDPSCDCICFGFTSFCTPGAEAIQCGCP